MKILAGTSGYAYKEWKGPFYPEKLPQKEFLRHYATRLPTVEINNTFYRMPTSKMVDGWAEQVPESFRFVLKASRRITHHARLADCAELVGYFLENATRLGDRLGPILFQLPPYVRKDVDRLRSFLTELPAGVRAAVEFRHDSWDDDEVHDVLREAGAALVLSDKDDDESSEGEGSLVPTARFGYLRLRRAEYSNRALASWTERIRSQPWDEAYAFFKHDEQGNEDRKSAHPGRFSSFDAAVLLNKMP